MTDVERAADDAIRQHWDTILVDMETAAQEYAESGWDPLMLHPGDVTVLTGEGSDHIGFSVLVPDNEFTDLQGLLAGDTDLNESEVYGSNENGVAFRLVISLDRSHKVAVLFPIYYRLGSPQAATLREIATDSGTVATHIRRLQSEQLVTITHHDPGLFF